MIYTEIRGVMLLIKSFIILLHTLSRRLGAPTGNFHFLVTPQITALAQFLKSLNLFIHLLLTALFSNLGLWGWRCSLS